MRRMPCAASALHCDVMRKLLWVVFLAMGCGSGTSTSTAGSVNGTVKGTAFNVQDASYVSTSTWKGGFSGVTTAVTMTDFSGICAQAAAGGAPKSAQLLILSLVTMNSSGSSALSATVGDYTVVGADNSPGAANARLASVYWEQTGTD